MKCACCTDLFYAKAYGVNVFYAKATMPPGNPWKTSWTTKAIAEHMARKFVHDWQQIGVTAEATVFYRDGSVVSHWPQPQTVDQTKTHNTGGRLK